MSVVEISPKELFDRLAGGSSLHLIDVRTPGEYASEHIAGSKNIPLGSSEMKDLKNVSADGKPLVFICQGGTRARKACEEVVGGAAGSVTVLAGGVNGWKAAALPIVSGKGAISMERQVRIAAGLFVVIGTILGFAVAPGFYFIPLFVGSGLMFSGITDTCGMARVLALMPWNSGCRSATSCDMKVAK